LCDEEGKICARIKRLALRVPEAEEIGEETGVLMFVPVWKEQAANKTGEASLFNRHLVILCEQDKVLPESIQKGIEGVRCIALKSDAAEIEERFRTYSVKIFEKIRDIMQERPKGKVLVQVVVPGWEERGLYSGLTGLLKTAGKENPNIMGQLVELAGQEDCEGIVEKLREAGKKPVESHIRYLKGRRLILSWEEIDDENEKVTIPWKDRGIYLITGGLGGLGFIFAYEIAHRTKDAVLILTGRSALGKDNELKLRKLEQLVCQGPVQASGCG
jgi:acyl transferase domain-containing protein